MGQRVGGGARTMGPREGAGGERGYPPPRLGRPPQSWHAAGRRQVLMELSLPVRDHLDPDGVQGTIHTQTSADDRDLVARASIDPAWSRGRDRGGSASCKRIRLPRGGGGAL